MAIELPASGWLKFSTAGLQPVFWHFLLVGWITQIIMGVSVWMIRVFLSYLLFAVVAGGLLLINKGMFIDLSVWNLLQIHIEVALFGWLLQFVLGTAYWILPRYLEGPKRGSKWRAWSMVIFLNIGIWICIFAYTGVLPETGMLAGRVLELAAVGLFLSLHWNRIVAYQRGH